jgi:hypothetical protein
MMSTTRAGTVLDRQEQLARRLLVELGDLQESLAQPVAEPLHSSTVSQQRERVISLARSLDDPEGLKQLCDLAEQLHAKQIASATASTTVSEEDKADIRRWLEEQDSLPGHAGCVLDINGTGPLSDDELRVHVFDNVLSLAACHKVVAAAEEHGWTTGRHAAHPTVDVSVFEVDAISQWLPAVLAESLIRPLERKFGLCYGLTLDDCFVAKYELDGQPSLGAHEDSSDWSFVLVLNDSFDGGGTRFESLLGKPVYRPTAGSAIGFNGQNRHSGLPVTRGVRYILAGFLIPAEA